MALAGAAVLSAAMPATAAQSRLKPPATACDINQLTSYSGRVTGYRRGKTSTWLRIATDEDTVEEVRVPHDGAPDARAHFLLRREPFPAGDLATIERARGKLRAGMRVVAWVCRDGRTAPRIDWQPAEEH